MIALPIGVGGRYKLEVHKVDSKGRIIGTRVAADWFDNLITDGGLDSMGFRANNLQYCHVGSGNAAPQNSDSSLAQFVASTSTIQGGTQLSARNTPPYYVSAVKTFRFSAGQAAGNISEVGVGWAATAGSLWSRALIKDGNGNPIAITVLGDEVLDVTYEVRTYPPVVDVVGVVAISGVNYNYTLRAANVDNAGSNVKGWAPYTGQIMGIYNNANTHAAYDGAIGSIVDGPVGAQSSIESPTDFAYVPGSLQRQSRLSAGLNSANLVGGIRSVLFVFTAAAYQVEFSPNIPKDGTKTFSLDVMQTWGRHTP